MKIKALSDLKFDEKTTVLAGQLANINDDATAEHLISIGAAEAAEEAQEVATPDPSELNDL